MLQIAIVQCTSNSKSVSLCGCTPLSFYLQDAAQFAGARTLFNSKHDEFRMSLGSGRIQILSL